MTEGSTVDVTFYVSRMNSKQHYVCSCYYTNNFFIRRLGHVVFVDRAQFIKDYSQVVLTNSNYCVARPLSQLRESVSQTRSMYCNVNWVCIHQ